MPRRPRQERLPLPRGAGAGLLAALALALGTLVAGVWALVHGFVGLSDALTYLMLLGMAVFAFLSLWLHRSLREPLRRPRSGSSG